MKITRRDSWNGLIESLENDEIDMAFANLFVTNERLDFIEYTVQIVQGQYVMVAPIANSAKDSIFSFFFPLNSAVWISIFTAFLFVTVLYFLMNFILTKTPISCSSAWSTFFMMGSHDFTSFSREVNYFN